MNTNPYISAWLEDQIDDSEYEFPKDFDFDSAVDQLADWFNHEIVTDHLDALLTQLLKEIKS